MNNIWSDLKYRLFQSGSKLSLLIGINVFVFLAINIPSVFEQLFLARPSFIKAYAFEYLAMLPRCPICLVGSGLR